MALRKTIIFKLILLINFLWVEKCFAQPVADFSATPLTGCGPLLVKFTDASSGNPTIWKWDLGNGTTSNSQNPSTTYFASGQYNITLIAISASGSDTIIKTQYITVQPNPVAAFSGTPLSGCLPLAAQFTDQSTTSNGLVNSWRWDFGDGFIDSVQNPNHAYTTAGTFDVTLQVKNTLGCVGSISKVKYINTSNSVVASFSNNLQSNCKPPVNLNFQNLSTGPATLSYQWDFGDSFTSLQPNPSHAYSSAGNFTVKLITTSSASGCSDTIKKVIAIGTVNADFISPATVCQAKPFSIANGSSPAPVSVSWNFGDGTTSNSLNPVKIYNTSGSFNIKMIADFGACLDSVTKPVTVLSKQNISFTADDSGSCKAPFTVNFTSNVPGATSISWNFGDGFTSTNPNPTHTYNTFGNFDVTLIAANNSGCLDTLIKPGYIKVQTPSVTLPGLPAGNCIPFSYTFIPAINSVDSVIKYDWNFGNGNTASTPNPTNTYNNVGTYDVSLTITTITGCTASVQAVSGISAGTKGIADFKASPLVSCVNIPVSFTDLSVGGINEWLWDFGDGAKMTIKNPKHRFQDTGFFTITLIGKSNGCPDTVSRVNYIYINPPVAAFSIKNNCLLPYQKTFSDGSKSADTYLWDFGDGLTSNSKSPTHVYADTGTYKVLLTVTNATTGCQDTLSRNALVINEKADFVASNTASCKNSDVTFKSQNINVSKISTYNWSFGDGIRITTSVDSVNHKYSTSGIFNVRLIITNLLGCKDTLLKTSYVKVDGPVAKFTSSLQTSCANTNIDFTDNSLSDGVHPIVTWTWDFGDTTETFTAPPFKHIYARGGTYTIKLKVTDSNGCMDSVIRSNYIFISKPVANFISADTTSCPLAPVNFTSFSQGSNLIYLWSFGDGATADSANPVHQYLYTDTFNVGLKITDKYGCTDSLQKINYIAVSYPKADFTQTDSVSACPPFSVTFTSTSINYTMLSWDFGDGNFSSSPTPTHSYFLPGNYVIKLRATGPGGCYDEKLSSIIVKGPKGVFNYTNITGCDSVTTNFTASATNNISFTWDFNDGNTLKTTDSVISHTYTDTGFYLPKLILEDINGCQVPIPGIDTIKVFTVKADFNSLSYTLCDAGIISFIDSSFSNDVVTNWQWNFGDASTSPQQDPAHYYSSPGLYTVSLIATTANGCKDTATKAAYTKIVARPDIGIQGNTAVCKFDTLIFKGIFLQPDTSIVTWQWDFANGQISSLQNPPSQIYSTAGNYIINAIATNSTGCKDTASQSVTINPLPNTNAGSDAFLCLGSTAQLQASGALTYQWLPPVNFLSCINCANPVTTTPNDITYVVRGTDAIGCSFLDSVTIKVKKPFTISINPAADSVCIGDGVQLNASNAENYLWTPSQTLNNATIQNPIASPVVNTVYKVLAFDSANCFKDSAFVNISVFNRPTVDAGSDKTIKAGESVSLSPVYSNDVTSWLWTPPANLSCSDCPAPMAKPTTTTVYTIQVTNNGGCTATDQVTILTTCKGENIFIPNAFSPNGDGINDIFYPRGNGINRIKALRIYNRWGETVFERSNFVPNDQSFGWDGTFKGKKAPSDVYVFMIDVICDNNDLVSRSGNVMLLR